MQNKNYYNQVFEITKLIPKGRVSTYGAIADYLALGSARMVGWALNKIDFLDDSIPAHRVVNSKGELSGRLAFTTPDTMQKKLESEGLIIKNWKVQDFNKMKWHPRELDEI
ncbi:MAG: MGMT family protein [Saprospiraceae bacterium]